MTFFIPRIIRAFVAPNSRIVCRRSLWQHALSELQRRGAGQRESGAFLLGRHEGLVRRVLDLAYYDDLDPTALDAGYVHLHRCAYTALWKRCDVLGLEVIADVHTHPAQAFLSEADRTHPTIPQVGHVAIIVPNYANAPFDSQSLDSYGVYEYLGRGAWKDFSGINARSFFYVGVWG